MKVGPTPSARLSVKKQSQGQAPSFSDIVTGVAVRTCAVGGRKAVQWENLTARQKQWIFFAICSELFLGQLGFAIFAPFFPEEAGKKGVSPLTLGWIFGVFQIVVVAFTPLTMKILPVAGPTNLLNVSNFLTGFSNIAFGYSWYANAGPQFIFMCFLTRIVAGVGVSMEMVIGYGLLPYLYEESLSTASSIVETVLGVAFIVAPVIGSGLYLLGGGASGQGYVLPFVLLGTCQCIFGIIMLACFPHLPIESESNASIFAFSPRVFVPLAICVISSAVIEFTGPTLQPFLADAPFHFGVARVGFVYAVSSIVYTVCGPLVGMLDDRSEGAWSIPIMLFGIFGAGAGYVVLAPADWVQRYVPLALNVNGMWLGICLIGSSAAFGLVPTYGSIFQCALDKDDKTAASNATSALYTIVYGVGAFLGPTLGGALGDAFGTASSYSLCGVFCMMVSVVFLVGLSVCGGGIKTRVEAENEEPLLHS